MTSEYNPGFERSGAHVIIHWPDGRQGRYDEYNLQRIIANLQLLVAQYPARTEWEQTLATYKAGLEFLGLTKENPNG